MAIVLGLLGLGAAGCIRVKTEPIEIKPIHITMDINLKIQRELDRFFGDLDSLAETMESPSESKTKSD